ncbi:MAG: hypothetical protein MRY74_11210 [Neomegalonema sp.]|nr:hypothetical protein [Neomegalonema sp.]
MTSARIFGALLYGAAAAGAAIAALHINDEMTVRAMRESAPLAFLLGGFLGFLVVSAWPRWLLGAVLTGILMAAPAIVFFSALYLVGDALIASAQGLSASDAVFAAMKRLQERLPIATPLVVASFAAAGFVLWVLAAIGRLFRGRRAGA